jgi:hypothetical protein
VIYVTNHSEDVISGRYAGVDYDFPPGSAVPVSREACAHIFGYGLADKKDAFMRLGWLRFNGDETKATHRLGKLSFSNDEPLPDNEQQPALLQGETPETVEADGSASSGEEPSQMEVPIMFPRASKRVGR